MVLFGQIEPSLIFDALDKVDLRSVPSETDSVSVSEDGKTKNGTTEKSNGTNSDVVMGEAAASSLAWSSPIPPLRENRSEVVRFPSEGTIKTYSTLQQRIK